MPLYRVVLSYQTTAMVVEAADADEALDVATLADAVDPILVSDFEVEEVHESALTPLGLASIVYAEEVYAKYEKHKDA